MLLVREQMNGNRMTPNILSNTLSLHFRETIPLVHHIMIEAPIVVSDEITGQALLSFESPALWPQIARAVMSPWPNQTLRPSPTNKQE
jgi:hypothetical protein